MVFSFFKKQTEKMPERPAARPRAPAPAPEAKPSQSGGDEVGVVSQPLPDLEFTASDVSSPSAALQEKAPAQQQPISADNDLDFTHDDFDKDFAESSVMAIDVEHGLDPVQSDVEQVVVLFANGQDAVARTLLEGFVQSYSGAEAKRFWLLLLDLLQVTGDRAGFESYGVEYAQACETSPPTWREQAPVEKPKAGGPRVLALQGVLTSDNAKPVEEIKRVLEQGATVVVDCGKLAGIDDDLAGMLADTLHHARRKKLPLSMQNVDAFLARTNERLVAGDAAHEPSWRLLLELLQRHGTQDAFEERAVDYAVTFELSPPSWETPPANAVPKVPLPVPDVDDAHFLCGDLKNQRFDDLAAVLEMHEHPILDFSKVNRVDFFSAGQLVNRIAPVKAQGKDVIIRSPNHLVAELMAVVGLNKQARIIVPKS
ncbi:STAS domain-containing protein [Azonexus sp. IMCC34839]|uniref:STAS domain-containing protein n=1 Tax=Azonexus sp. IMCC34839 TaxID=3133695 RepID=UPI00399AD8D9